MFLIYIPSLSLLLMPPQTMLPRIMIFAYDSCLSHHFVSHVAISSLPFPIASDPMMIDLPVTALFCKVLLFSWPIFVASRGNISPRSAQ